MRILVVDDDETIVNALTILLERDGHQVVGHTNPLLATQESNFDIILTDLSMPSLDGIELLKYVEKNHPQARRFLMTAFSTNTAIKQALETGLAQKVFPKPWHIAELREAMQ